MAFLSHYEAKCLKKSSKTLALIRSDKIYKTASSMTCCNYEFTVSLVSSNKWAFKANQLIQVAHLATKSNLNIQYIPIYVRWSIIFHLHQLRHVMLLT